MRKELEVFFISLLVIIFSLWTYRLTAADPPAGCCKDNLCGSWGNGLCSSHPCYGDDPCLAVDCYGWKCRAGLCIGKD